MSGCVYDCLREAHLEKYHENFLKQGVTKCEGFTQLQMHDYIRFGVVSMQDRVRLFKLIQIIKSVQSEGMYCKHDNGCAYTQHGTNAYHSRQHHRTNQVPPGGGEDKQSKSPKDHVFERKTHSRVMEINPQRERKSQKTSEIRKKSDDVEFRPGTGSPIFKCRKVLSFSDSEEDEEDSKPVKMDTVKVKNARKTHIREPDLNKKKETVKQKVVDKPEKLSCQTKPQKQNTTYNVQNKHAGRSELPGQAANLRQLFLMKSQKNTQNMSESNRDKKNENEPRNQRIAELETKRHNTMQRVINENTRLKQSEQELQREMRSLRDLFQMKAQQTSQINAEGLQSKEHEKSNMHQITDETSSNISLPQYATSSGKDKSERRLESERRIAEHEKQKVISKNDIQEKRFVKDSAKQENDDQKVTSASQTKVKSCENGIRRKGNSSEQESGDSGIGSKMSYDHSTDKSSSPRCFFVDINKIGSLNSSTENASLTANSSAEVRNSKQCTPRHFYIEIDPPNHHVKLPSSKQVSPKVETSTSTSQPKTTKTSKQTSTETKDIEVQSDPTFQESDTQDLQGTGPAPNDIQSLNSQEYNVINVREATSEPPQPAGPSAFFISQHPVLRQSPNNINLQKNQRSQQNHAYFPAFSSPKEQQEKPPQIERIFHNSDYDYGVPGNGQQRKNSTGSPGKGRGLDERIRVCVRKRPLTRREKKEQNLDIVHAEGENTIVVEEAKVAIDLSKYIQQHLFLFDEVFGEECSNTDVYERTAKPLVHHVLNGGNATCFAFGQTGAGKTHTLLGGEGVAGLYQLAGSELCELLAAGTPRPALHLWVSYYEIYCGQLYDILNKKKKLQVRENGKQKVCVAGLMETEVYNVRELIHVVEYGNASRSTGSTGVNPHSSRSHAVLQLEVRTKQDTIIGRLSFIDLAGSERASDRTDFDRQTRIEGAEINQSLLALKECIRAIDQDSKHTPYRQSKLTHILRDSFVGNSRTCMIANVAPTHGACENTLNTLRYADRVKELRSSITSNSSAMPAAEVMTSQVHSGKSQGPMGLFHPSTIQYSSTPKMTKSSISPTRALDLSHVLQDEHDSPIRGHKIRKSGDRKANRSTPQSTRSGSSNVSRESPSSQRGREGDSSRKNSVDLERNRSGSSNGSTRMERRGGGHKTPHNNSQSRTPASANGHHRTRKNQDILEDHRQILSHLDDIMDRAKAAISQSPSSVYSSPSSEKTENHSYSPSHTRDLLNGAYKTGPSPLTRKSQTHLGNGNSHSYHSDSSPNNENVELPDRKSLKSSASSGNKTFSHRMPPDDLDMDNHTVSTMPKMLDHRTDSNPERPLSARSIRSDHSASSKPDQLLSAKSNYSGTSESNKYQRSSRNSQHDNIETFSGHSSPRSEPSEHSTPPRQIPERSPKLSNAMMEDMFKTYKTLVDYDSAFQHLGRFSDPLPNKVKSGIIIPEQKTESKNSEERLLSVTQPTFNENRRSNVRRTLFDSENEDSIETRMRQELPETNIRKKNQQTGTEIYKSKYKSNLVKDKRQSNSKVEGDRLSPRSSPEIQSAGKHLDDELSRTVRNKQTAANISPQLSKLGTNFKAADQLQRLQSQRPFSDLLGSPSNSRKATADGTSHKQVTMSGQVRGQRKQDRQLPKKGTPVKENNTPKTKENIKMEENKVPGGIKHYDFHAVRERINAIYNTSDENLEAKQTCTDSGVVMTLSNKGHKGRSVAMSDEDDDLSEASTLDDIPSLAVEPKSVTESTQKKKWGELLREESRQEPINELEENLEDIHAWRSIEQGLNAMSDSERRLQRALDNMEDGSGIARNGSAGSEQYYSPVKREKLPVIGSSFAPIHPVPQSSPHEISPKVPSVITKTTVTHTSSSNTTDAQQSLAELKLKLDSQHDGHYYKSQYRPETTGGVTVGLTDTDTLDSPHSSGSSRSRESAAQRAQNLLISAHEEQLAEITTLCKQEMKLLLSVKVGDASFEDYVSTLRELLSFKSRCIATLRSQIKEFSTFPGTARSTNSPEQ